MSHESPLLAAFTLRSGSLSMASGEFISVSQQADSERADVETERRAQNAGPEVRAHELQELQQIWKERGLSEDLAWEVAQQLTDHDAVRAHARDELGIDIDNHPSGVQAALSSMVCTIWYRVDGFLPAHYQKFF
jgi:VIT1/CCC1 family predicted Fe2+/Mn2+ transporter